jgi:ATP-dependent DNA helicase RecG
VRQLPFELTGDQKKAIVEITRDLARSSAMTRLVQGDVGSGKTVVALAAAALAASAGFQTALMAPTEILAQQHLRTAEKLLAPLGVKTLLLSHGNTANPETRQQIADGSAKLVVGTHALFQQSVRFHRLGLVVVDEQHRFGVEQRAELVRKASDFPHVLLMTATPIPRTLALTLYGDLDLTLIREKPANRKSIRTTLIRDRDRHRLYEKIRGLIGEGRQVYLIYPLVEASEKLDLKSATEMYEKLRQEVFPDVPIALLHGKMKSDEKDRILDEFKQGKHRCLVATTVVEVGIDVPNATLMVIEHPERLGLSQLHQLRGRVGRGEESSECVLVVEDKVSARLRIFVETEDGFAIAEEDLKLRGPGEFLGTRQSGLPGFRAGHIVHDAALVCLARDEAVAILDRDPKLQDPAHQRIREMVESRWKEKIERLRGG